MKKTLGSCVVLALAINLGGCGWLFGDKGVFRDRGDDYRRASLEKPLVVPPGLSPVIVDEDTVIPPIAYSATLEGTFEVPQPDPLEGNPEAEMVKIQKLNTENWILVEATPGEVWPRVRQFLTTNQLTVLRTDPNAGVIETGWLQPTAADAKRERYRFRIEQGVQRGSSEVYIVQADAGTGENWPQASSNPGREADMMKALAQFIADNGSTGSVSMLAQRAIDSKGKVFMHKKQGEHPYLLLELSSDRAWASLSAALPKSGLILDDLNRDDHELRVHYEPPKELEEEKGWWDSFWAWVWSPKKADEIEKNVGYLVRIDPAPATTGTAANAAVQISVARQDGKPLSGSVEEQLLNLVKGKLS